MPKFKWMERFIPGCPWGDMKLDLSKEILTSSQKYWIANQIISGLTSIKEINLKYNISEHRLKDYVTRVRKGLTLHTENGRPKALDNQSIENISKIISGSPEISTERIKKLIKEEYVETIKRRNLHSLDKKIKPIQYASLHKYLSYFERKHNINMIETGLKISSL